MTTPSAIDSGYVIEALYFPVQQLTPAEADSESGEIAWGWDWRWNSHHHFEVGLLFGAPAGSSRPERMEVAATAIFRVVGESQTVPVPSFAYAHAPALLFPYIRQVVDELTSRSPFGRIVLPPTNVLALMTKFNAEEATGVRQPRPTA